MSSEQNSIHDFDFTLICDYFSRMHRQGPGSRETTHKALSFIPALGPESRIADLGCGTGTPTLDLAEVVGGHITGLDLFPEFIDLFHARIVERNLQHRITAQTGSMDALPFPEASLDLIWAEGSIYNIGFERGLTEWRNFLKPGGFIAVSEATWFTKERPREITDFWMNAYPGIDTVGNKVLQMQSAGYIPLAAFILPENCWLEEFYHHQPAAQEAFLKKFPDNAAALGLVENECREAALYDQYKAYYGYAFYIGQKIR